MDGGCLAHRQRRFAPDGVTSPPVKTAHSSPLGRPWGLMRNISLYLLSITITQYCEVGVFQRSHDKWCFGTQYGEISYSCSRFGCSQLQFLLLFFQQKNAKSLVMNKIQILHVLQSILKRRKLDGNMCAKTCPIFWENIHVIGSTIINDFFVL